MAIKLINIYIFTLTRFFHNSFMLKLQKRPTQNTNHNYFSFSKIICFCGDFNYLSIFKNLKKEFIFIFSNNGIFLRRRATPVSTTIP